MIYQCEFYQYNPFYFDEHSVLTNKVINNSYITKTRGLISKENNIQELLILGFHRQKWYPLILPLNVKDKALLKQFAKVLSTDYNSQPLTVSDLFNHLSIENELDRLNSEQTQQLNFFLDVLKELD